MAIDTPSKKKILRHLDKYGIVTVSSADNQINRMQVKHKGRLTIDDYFEFCLLARITTTEFYTEAIGKTHIIVFHS